MADTEGVALGWLRGLLGLTGLLAALVGISIGQAEGLAPVGVAGGVVAMILGLAPGLARNVRLVGAVLLALLALYFRYTGHASTPFPAVDWIRPRGMDVWPGLLQAAGMLLLVATAPSVLRGVGGRGLRAGAVVGCVLAVAYWFYPQHFVIDELGPAVAGRATMPVVIEGRIQPRSWGRAGVPGTPITTLPDLVENERRLAAIAHGMGHEAARLAGENTGSQVRATLWGIQHALTPVVLWAGLLSIGVAVLVGLGLVRRRPLPEGLCWGAFGLLSFGLVGPPTVNLGLRLVGLVGGLPEATDDVWLALMLSVAMLGSGLVAMAVGLAVRMPAEGEE